MRRHTISPVRVLLPIGIGTCFSLFGDAALYAVLPTYAAEIGVPMVSVGILLSANRFIRLLTNGAAGVAYDRWRRRRLFVSALFIGASSTALYALTQGFWLLLLGRLLWGLAWSGIWVGGNTAMLDVAHGESRGKWVGAYQVFFYLGAATGALLGGALTDHIGYRETMAIWAALTFFGATIALLFLPETRGLRDHTREIIAPPESRTRPAPQVSNHTRRTEFAMATALYSVNRLAVAGIFSSTFGLFLLTQMGDDVHVAGLSLGVATLAGLGLGLTTLISALSAPAMGGVSDRVSSRWRAAAGGLTPGIGGFILLAVGLPWTVIPGVPLVAITSGSNQGLSTALIGDLGTVGWQSRQLGAMFTAGDLASAVGPLLAYALVPLIGIRDIYLLVGLLLACVFVSILAVDRRQRAQRAGLAVES